MTEPATCKACKHAHDPLLMCSRAARLAGHSDGRWPVTNSVPAAAGNKSIGRPRAAVPTNAAVKMRAYRARKAVP